jgi:MFS family permease
MTADRRTGELFLNIGHALDHLFLLIYPTVVLAMAPEFGKTYGEMLPLSIGGFIMFGAGSIPAGWLADRWSRRGMMIVFFTGMGAASVLAGLAETPWQIGMALTLVGTFGAIYHPVGITMLVSGRDKVGRVLGVNGVWGNLGVAFAALLAGALAHWFNWRVAFIVPGVVAIATGIAFARTVPADFGLARSARKEAHAGLPRAVLMHVFVVLAIAVICGGVIFNATTVAMPKVFDEKLRALVNTTFGIGVMVSLVYAFAALAQLCVGWWIDRHSIKSVFVVVVALQIPLLLLAAGSENVAMLIVALGMMFFVFGQIPINDAMVAAYSDERWRARAYALRYVVSFLGSASAVPLVAYTHSSTAGFASMFLVLAGLATIMFCAALTFPGAPVTARNPT